MKGNSEGLLPSVKIESGNCAGHESVTVLSLCYHAQNIGV